MPINSDLISLYAAHNIDMRVTETWSPIVYREPRALVPCELNVLMVRNPQQQWADCKMKDPPTADPTVAAAPIPAEDLMPHPFDVMTQPRDKGAYLHWYLPNALTSGEADSDPNKARFRQLPDRWLVLRLSTDATLQRRKARGWVLNAGVNPPTVTDLNLWTETGNPDPNMVGQSLTALGKGDLSWAGYYDNVENVLGFHDKWLDSDAVIGPISYVVCGWYAEPSADPLGDTSIRSSAQFYALLQRLGWHIDEAELETAREAAQQYLRATTALQMESYSYFDGRFTPRSKETPWWPRSVLLHAAVVGIGWPNDTSGQQEAGGPPSASSIKVAVGNTMAEAMGTLIARANNNPAEAQIVEALQLGAIRDLEQADGRAKLDLALHASSFASYSGGDPSVEPLTIPPSGPPPGSPSDPPAPGPGVFATPQPPLHAGGFRSPLSTQRNLDLFAGSASVQRDLPKIEVSGGLPHSVRVEEIILQGNIAHVIDQLGLGRQPPVYDPGGTVDSNRAAPRLYTPKDPVLLVQGGKRAFVHDSSVHTEDGVLNCRLGSVTSLSWHANGQQYSTNPNDILAGGISNGSVPPECQAILHETVLLDPGSAQVAVNAAVSSSAAAPGGSAARASFDSLAARSNIAVEQTVWWALRDPRVNHQQLLAQSGITGVLPATFSISPPSRPWTPTHLDWQVEYVSSPNRVADWTLDEIDYDHSAPLPASGGGKIFSGRAMLTSGASSSLAAAVRNAQKQAAAIGGGGNVPVGVLHEAHFSTLARTLTESFASLSLSGGVGVESGDLADIVSELDQIDILSCGLDGLLKQLRAGLAPGKTPDNTAAPAGFVSLRAGALYFKRLRLVDGFGQFLDICESGASAPVSGLIISDAVSIGRTDAIGLPPRFTAPSRLWFRYMRADSVGDAPQGQEADYKTSPVCGYVMPNHLDGALEFFNADGSGAGTLLSDDGGLVRWEDTPGLVTAAGQDPAQALSNSFMAGIANGLIDWGVADSGRNDEAAMRAFLRTIDTTLWTVDPFGHAGDEHLSLLVGHPVAAMRAMLRLEVADPIASEDTTVTAVPVELGNLVHWQDGLLGYFVNDDYTVLYTATASAAMARPCGPRQGFLEQINLVPQRYANFAADIDPTADAGAHAVVHPYVDTSGRIWVRPNQTVMLTLIVEPLTSVHATAGLVPRKEIAMQRGWVSDGLAKIAPTFRFGPVLVDPQRIKMPIAADIQGNWTWDYRADSVKWREGPVTNATDAALLAPDPPTAMEGWLRLDPLPPDSGS